MLEECSWIYLSLFSGFFKTYQTCWTAKKREQAFGTCGFVAFGFRVSNIVHEERGLTYLSVSAAD